MAAHRSAGHLDLGGGAVSAALEGLTFDRMQAALEDLGVGAAHASRVFRAIHREGVPPERLEALGRARRARVAEAPRVSVELLARQPSADGTEKVVLRLADGARVESVLIPMWKGRYSVCVSSQVGCAMGCTFCATGTLGFSRNLSTAEILAQVHAARDRARELGGSVAHVVFMGMGEPLANYEAVRDALRILRDPHGLCLAARKLTVSTVGVIPKMRAFSRDFAGRVQLALSLHAGTDETRRQIIPLAERYPLAELRDTLLAHPLPGTRAPMLEYVVLPGLNDSEAELEALAAWMQGLRALVNLIPFNPFGGAPFRSPTEGEVTRVSKRLRALGVPSSIRWPKGRESASACGQLALTVLPPEHP